MDKQLFSSVATNIALENQIPLEMVDSYVNFALEVCEAFDSELVGSKPIWAISFDEYCREGRLALNELSNDKQYVKTLQECYPDMDIIRSLKNAWILYWGTEEGWNKKRRAKVKKINWKTTYQKSIKINAVWGRSTQAPLQAPQGVKFVF
jgi:hypothetical protein